MFYECKLLMPGNIMNFSLYSDSDGNVLSKVLLGKPDIEKPDTTLPKNREDVQLQDSSKGCIIPQAHTIPQPTDTSFFIFSCMVSIM
jgi:hypothetical protein